MTDRAAVIGGGPAGLIAAETLAQHGVGVTLYEHRRSVGRKFLLAGRSGLNLTHAEPFDDFIDRYGPARTHLEAAVRAFGPDALRAWSAGLGEATFVGTSDRVFPESFRATPLLRSWLHRLNELGVTIEAGHRWVGFGAGGANRFEVEGRERVVSGDATVLALGGASWPRVGSGGGWVDALTAEGIAVTPLVASNCGFRVTWSRVLRERFAGEPIKNAVFWVGSASARGDAVVTDGGLEGGPVYALGPALRSALASATGPPTMTIDLHPDIDDKTLVERLSKRRPKASATSWLRSAGVAPVAVALAREATGNDLPDSAVAMAALLKRLPVAIEGLAPLDRAISTAGGVAFDEIDDRFMLRRRPGVFVAGEMLDWDAPTGGYLLQACFSTGVAAARGALAWLGGGRAN